MLGKPFYDLDLWPVTLIFKVNPDIIQVDPWPKFGDLRTIGLAPGSLEVKCVGALKERNKETRGKLKGRALHWPKYRNLSLCINKVLIISTLFFSVLPVVCQGNKKPLFTFVVLEVGRFKVLELERIYRIAPAVTDCHCDLPDRWSCGRSWDSRWSSRRCQRSLPSQPMKPTCSGSPCLNKGCRTVNLAILYSPAGWRSSETWNWVPALPVVRDASGGRCTVPVSCNSPRVHFSIEVGNPLLTVYKNGMTGMWVGFEVPVFGWRFGLIWVSRVREKKCIRIPVFLSVKFKVCPAGSPHQWQVDSKWSKMGSLLVHRW